MRVMRNLDNTCKVMRLVLKSHCQGQNHYKILVRRQHFSGLLLILGASIREDEIRHTINLQYIGSFGTGTSIRYI